MIGINRTIVGIIGLSWIVAPGGSPEAVVQEIPAAADEHQIGAIMSMPPVVIVPFAVIIPEGGIMRALPIFCAVNVIVVLICHAVNVWFWPLGNVVEVLGFPLCLIPLPAGKLGVVRQILSLVRDVWVVAIVETLVALVRDVWVIRVIGIIETLVALIPFVPLVHDIWVIRVIGIMEALVALVLIAHVLMLPSELTWMLGLLVLLPLLFLLIILGCRSDQWDRQTANEYGE